MNDIIREIKGESSYEDIINQFVTDLNQYPEIEIPHDLHDIFLLDNITDDYREKHFNYYDYQNIGVPRVSNILDRCINKEFLINWAIKLGLKRYMFEKNKATTIGSRTHELIEEYLLKGTFSDRVMYKTPPSMKKNVNIAFDNFKYWLNNMINHGIFISDIICIEKVISCPYFGGTVDCICRINGKVYLIDFKTSKRISIEYLMQVCAYTWIINSGYMPNLPKIDGVGIIRVDKESRHKYEDLFLSFDIPFQAQIINNYISNFGVLVQWFYTLLSMEAGFGKVKKETKNSIITLGGKDK